MHTWLWYQYSAYAHMRKLCSGRHPGLLPDATHALGALLSVALDLTTAAGIGYLFIFLDAAGLWPTLDTTTDFLKISGVAWLAMMAVTAAVDGLSALVAVALQKWGA